MGFQIAAFAIMLAFYSCYFAKMVAQRRKGIRTDQMGRGKTGFVKMIEVSLKDVSWTVPVAQVMCILFAAPPFPAPVRIVGACVGFAGVALFILSVVTMRDNWRAGVAEKEKTELVTGGVYQFSRNPAFLAFDLMYFGILLMFFHWALFAVSCLAALLFPLQIVNVEEDHLAAAFGEEYLRYKKTVGRYWGRKK